MKQEDPQQETQKSTGEKVKQKFGQAIDGVTSGVKGVTGFLNPFSSKEDEEAKYRENLKQEAIQGREYLKTLIPKDECQKLIDQIEDLRKP